MGKGKTVAKLDQEMLDYDMTSDTVVKLVQVMFYVVNCRLFAVSLEQTKRVQRYVETEPLWSLANRAICSTTCR